MEFWTKILVLLRSRRVILPALVVALAMGAAVYHSTPKVYSSSTTMVLTTAAYGGTESLDPTKPTGLTNPMLNFSDSLRTTTAILISAMGTRQVTEQLGATHPGTSLTVNDGRTNPELLGVNGPFLYLEARSRSGADAHQMVLDAQELTRQKLATWQSELNAPAKTFVNLVDVVPPTTPQPGSGRAIKLGVMAFLFGLSLCVGIAYFAGQIRTRRRAKTSAAPAEVDSTPEPEPRPFAPAPAPDPLVLLNGHDDPAAPTSVLVGTHRLGYDLGHDLGHDQGRPFVPTHNPRVKARARNR